MTPTPVIGVIAGMGPSSTTHFIDLLYEECRRQYGATLDEDYPRIIIYSLPTPYTGGVEDDHVRTCAIICECAEKMEAMGCTFLVMPCNTSHRYLEMMRKAIAIPVLDMIDLAVAEIPAGQLVSVIATSSTLAWGGYQSRLKGSGSQPVTVDALQSTVDEILAGLTAGKKAIDLTVQWETILAATHAVHADVLLIACTDLGVFAGFGGNMPCIDSGQVLASHAIRFLLRSGGLA